jgi:hypothetical protein
MEESSSFLVETMISLARSTEAHRVIVAGDYCSAMYFELHRRGYVRLGTMNTCRNPCGQFDIALLAARDQSKEEFVASLRWLVHFLHATGVIVIQLTPLGTATNEQLRQTLDRLGFASNQAPAVAKALSSVPAAFDSVPLLQSSLPHNTPLMGLSPYPSDAPIKRRRPEVA